MNYWLQRHKNRIFNVCRFCHKKVEGWFHAQGFICKECSKKGLTSADPVPDITDVFA